METIPKFVYLKILSIIHMRFGRTFFFVLNVAINNGTSAVDWWLAMTSVRSSKQFLISSPNSTTIKERGDVYRVYKQKQYYVYNYTTCTCHAGQSSDRNKKLEKQHLYEGQSISQPLSFCYWKNWLCEWNTWMIYASVLLQQSAPILFTFYLIKIQNRSF